jgi:radical SAM superfamily enzyme YgiQ (UPF0313 family)
MKVFLTQAAAYFPETERSTPLGVLYLASYLRERMGHDVRVFDMQLLVPTVEPVLEAVRAFSPDVIGIGGMTQDAPVIRELARRAKEAFPAAAIVVGGPHATNCADEVAAFPGVDFVIPHEGETAFAALVEHVAGRRSLDEVPSVVARTNGEVRRNPLAPPIEDLDALPFPAFDLVDLEAYTRIPRCGVIHVRRRYAALITSRGCPYRCIYCHNILGKKNRTRDAENVVNEMAWLGERFGVREFVIMDDMFNLRSERVNAFARCILDRGLDVRFSFPIGLRGDIMTEESVRLLARAGMFRCMYAIETASPRVQTLIRKNNDLDKLRRIIAYTRAQGVMVHGSFMLGFPTETEAEARASVDFAVRSDLHTAAFYRVIPFRGTELHRLAVESGARIADDPGDYEFHKADGVNVSAMPDAVLTRLRRSAYRRFYLSPRRLWAIFRALPNRRRLLPQLARIWLRKALLW